MTTIELANNEFVDNGDYLGFIAPIPDPFNFLSFEKLEKSTEDKWSTKVIFKLSEVKRTYHRQVYSLIVMLSDMGGFNGIIYLVPAWLMALYGERMYQA